MKFLVLMIFLWLHQSDICESLFSKQAHLPASSDTNNKTEKFKDADKNDRATPVEITRAKGVPKTKALTTVKPPYMPASSRPHLGLNVNGSKEQRRMKKTLDRRMARRRNCFKGKRSSQARKLDRRKQKKTRRQVGKLVTFEKGNRKGRKCLRQKFRRNRARRRGKLNKKKEKRKRAKLNEGLAELVTAIPLKNDGADGLPFRSSQIKWPSKGLLQPIRQLSFDDLKDKPALHWISPLFSQTHMLDPLRRSQEAQKSTQSTKKESKPLTPWLIPDSFTTDSPRKLKNFEDTSSTPSSLQKLYYYSSTPHWLSYKLLPGIEKTAIEDLVNLQKLNGFFSTLTPLILPKFKGIPTLPWLFPSFPKRRTSPTPKILREPENQRPTKIVSTFETKQQSEYIPTFETTQQSEYTPTSETTQQSEYIATSSLSFYKNLELGTASTQTQRLKQTEISTTPSSLPESEFDQPAHLFSLEMSEEDITKVTTQPQEAIGSSATYSTVKESKSNRPDGSSAFPNTTPERALESTLGWSFSESPEQFTTYSPTSVQKSDRHSSTPENGKEVDAPLVTSTPSRRSGETSPLSDRAKNPSTQGVTLETTQVTGPSTPLTEEPLSISLLIRLFSSCAIQNGGTNHTSIDTKCYTEAYQRLISILDHFGYVFSFAADDIRSKLVTLRRLRETHQAKSRREYDRLDTMFAYEFSPRGLAEAENEGTNALRWTLRALEMISRIIEEVRDENSSDLSTRVKRVYGETLGRYHTWLVRTVANAAFNYFPTREKFLELVEVSGDKGSLQEVDDLVNILDALCETINELFRKYETN